MTAFAGAIVPLVTPFHEDESLDLDTLVRLVEFHRARGVSALMPTALTGEGPLLTEEETRTVWDAVIDASSLPVIPAVLTTRTRTAIRLAEHAAARGAAALMAAPILPELYSGRSPEDAAGFYASLAAATPLPLILFNYPALTGIDLTAPLVARLAEIETVRAVKESTGEARRVHAIHRAAPRIEVICGSPVTALESFALGCRAWITGILNIAPEAGAALVSETNLPRAREIYYRRILPLADWIARTNNPAGVLKAGVEARGIACGAPRRPGRPLEPELARELAATIEESIHP